MAQQRKTEKLMKHAYNSQCNCARCDREQTRRMRQSANDPRPGLTRVIHKTRTRSRRSPIVGSAEWAETRGDDLGYSGDY